MAENFLRGSREIEAEIAQLQKMIETKRNQLEEQSGIVEEKELVRDALQEMISQAEIPELEISHSVDKPKTLSGASVLGNSYLDRLDQESAAKVAHYVEEISQHGIIKTVNKAMSESPFVVDALHDVLVDKLYEQLKAEGLIK